MVTNTKSWHRQLRWSRRHNLSQKSVIHNVERTQRDPVQEDGTRQLGNQEREHRRQQQNAHDAPHNWMMVGTKNFIPLATSKKLPDLSPGVLAPCAFCHQG